MHAHLLDTGPDRAHGDEMPSRLAASAVEAERFAVDAREDIGADGARYRRLGAEHVGFGVEREQRQRTDDDRLQLGGFAVIDDIDALPRPLVLLRAALEREALDMDEGARDSKRVTAARMHADAPVFVLDADAR